MSKFWSDCVHQLDPYVPGEQPKVANLIKLNTNENPYPPAPAVLQVLNQQAVNDLRLYPDPESVALREQLAKTYDVNTEQVFVGNGSDEVLGLAFKAFFTGKKAPLLYPDITYSFYPVYCQLLAIDFKTVALDENFLIDNKGYEQANGGIIFPNPNAPTAIAKPLVAIEELLHQHTESVVIVDEAYIDFGGESAIALVDKYPNLLVTQTFSKSRSLAGARVGFAMGNAELVAGLSRVKNSFNSYPLGRLAQAMAIEALKDQDYFEQCCQKIINTRSRVEKELVELGFECLPSAANFVLAKPPKDAEKVFAALREDNIIVRYFNKPRINEYLRITIGTDDEMQLLIDSLKKILAG